MDWIPHIDCVLIPTALVSVLVHLLKKMVSFWIPAAAVQREISYSNLFPSDHTLWSILTRGRHEYDKMKTQNLMFEEKFQSTRWLLRNSSVFEKAIRWTQRRRGHRAPGDERGETLCGASCVFVAMQSLDSDEGREAECVGRCSHGNRENIGQKKNNVK